MSMLAHLFDLYASLDPEGPHWIRDDDTGEDYCRKHALEKIAADGLDPDEQLDGGFSRETDSCCHCAKCGKLLAYTLTDEGQAAELDHFKSVKFRRNKPLDRETSYHLARMLWGNCDLDAIRVAARAIRCMGHIP